MKILNQYIKEIYYLKWYIIPIIVAIVLSYSVYLFFNVDFVSNLGEEDHFFEWLTALNFLAASIFFFP